MHTYRTRYFQDEELWFKQGINTQERLLYEKKETYVYDVFPGTDGLVFFKNARHDEHLNE